MANGYRFNNIERKLKLVRSHYDSMVGARDLLRTQFDDACNKAVKIKADIETFDKVSILLQLTSDFARKQAKFRIEEIVTSALSVVFDVGYKFWLELTVRANRPECQYFIEADGVTVRLEPPDYSKGGGVVDVVTLALRLAIIELEGNRGPLLLDEIGKMVSAEYAPNVAYFLRQYSEKFNRQIILITHSESLAAAGHKSFSVRQVNGRSVVS